MSRMFELDMPVTSGECYFCERYIVDKIDEHEETCPFPIGLDWSRAARIDRIYTNRLGRLSNNFYNIYNFSVMIQFLLRRNFCINCTSLEKHATDNCLLMTRNQAFEAIFPSLQFKMFQVYEDFNIAFKRAKEEDLSESIERRRTERQEVHDAFIEFLRNERVSSRFIRRIQREYRRMCNMWDDEATRRRVSVQEDCLLRYRRELQMCATGCQTLLAGYKLHILQIETNVSSDSMIRFVSTYNPEDRQQAEPLRIILYEDNE